MAVDRTQRLAVLHGLAVGDAMGAGTEFQSPTQIAARCGTITRYVPGSCFGFAPGEFTDDTQMTLATLAGYAAAPAGGRPLLAAVAGEFSAWLRSSPLDVGNLTRRAIAGYPGGLDGGLLAWAASGYNSAGNGALIRAAASIVAGRSGDLMRSEAVLLSALTHADPRSLASCLAFVLVLDAILNGAEALDAWDGVWALLDGHAFADEVAAIFGTEWHAPIAERTHAALGEVRTAATRGLGGDPGEQSGYVISTLQVAAWASRQPDYMDAISATAMRGNDSDTAGAVAGAVLGARGLVPPAHLLADLHCRHRWRLWTPPGSAAALGGFVP